MTEASLHTAQLHDWCRRMRAGDSQAPEEMLRAVGGRLERLARRMLRDFPNVRHWADTGDIFQEAVLRLLRSLRQLDPPPASARDFLNLAATHIRRELLDLARRWSAAKRRGEVPLREATSSSSGLDPRRPTDDPEELERWRCFHEEVERLPVEEREVVGLRFYHGWSDADIAELFGVTERTARRRWASGCARLGAALRGEMPVP